MCDTYNCDSLEALAHFVSKCNRICAVRRYDEFQSIHNFACFTVKSPSVTQRSVSQENAYKKQLNVAFRTFTSFYSAADNSFTLIEGQFQVFKYSLQMCCTCQE